MGEMAHILCENLGGCSNSHSSGRCGGSQLTRWWGWWAGMPRLQPCAAADLGGAQGQGAGSLGATVTFECGPQQVPAGHGCPAVAGALRAATWGEAWPCPPSLLQ